MAVEFKRSRIEDHQVYAVYTSLFINVLVKEKVTRQPVVRVAYTRMFRNELRVFILWNIKSTVLLMLILKYCIVFRVLS
jgi:hypothetical protein